MSNETDSKEKPVLDLGLAELAEQCDLQLDLRLAKLIARRASEQSEPDTSSDHGLTDFAEGKELSEYERLWQAERFAELISCCEEKFSSENEAERIISKLWWVRAHIILGQVPISILSAPLEFACSSLNSLQEQYRAEVEQFIIQVAHELAARLAKNGDNEQSLEWYRRIEGFGQDCSDQIAKLLHAIKNSLLEIPQYARTESQAQQLEEITSSLKDHQKAPVVENSSNFLIDDSNPPATAETARDSLLASGFLLSSIVSGMKKQLSFMRVVLLLCISSSLGIAYVSLSEALAPATLSDELVSLKSHSAQQIYPDLERMESAVALSAIFNSMDNQSQDNLLVASTGDAGNSSVPAGSSQIRVESQSVKAARQSDLDMSVQSKPDRVLAEVNTREPREPRQIYEILSSGGSTRTEQVRVIDENFVRGFPGGSAHQGFPVYRYDPPRLYRVKKETAFLSRPSQTAQKIDMIPSEVNLVVEEDLGQWLKVRRKDAKIGYVSSQDTEYTGKKYIP